MDPGSVFREILLYNVKNVALLLVAILTLHHLRRYVEPRPQLICEGQGQDLQQEPADLPTPWSVHVCATKELRSGISILSSTSRRGFQEWDHVPTIFSYMVPLNHPFSGGFSMIYTPSMSPIDGNTHSLVYLVALPMVQRSMHGSAVRLWHAVAWKDGK